MTNGLTYDHVGITRDPGAALPPGFRRLRERTRLGDGPDVYAAAERALFGWRMHRATGLRVPAGTPDAAPGVRVRLRIGPLSAPCEVVWAEHGPERAGFAYGTLAGHPERGEESFVVRREPDGSVWLDVTAFSRPATWYMGLLGPLGHVTQRVVARRYGRCLRRLSQDETIEKGS
ncbi:DUF1990 domain-containing protein [Streptomyces sp. NPDC088354]|uniref:DUF1990 family protein n=1 Tax=unclassified Streptomyces TaxID=2593676 RepID=UPI0029A20588|nr:DUF1990 domain-containing protein [Streptomyces sp. MI02-7b]MDX3073935.1 DUF1990 domain-containing protein [Streptomyces sp. MI02-7b]